MSDSEGSSEEDSGESENGSDMSTTEDESGSGSESEDESGDESDDESEGGGETIKPSAAAEADAIASLSSKMSDQRCRLQLRFPLYMRPSSPPTPTPPPPPPPPPPPKFVPMAQLYRHEARAAEGGSGGQQAAVPAEEQIPAHVLQALEELMLEKVEAVAQLREVTFR